MTDFIIRFLISNLILCGIIGILLAARHFFRKELTPRMRCHLWCLLLVLLAVPFLPLDIPGPAQLLLRFGIHSDNGTSKSAAAGTSTLAGLSDVSNPLYDFTLSVGGKVPSTVGLLLSAVWIAGVITMLFFMAKSLLSLHTLKHSALPLQNPAVRIVYTSCCRELGITKELPVCSTAYLKAPILTGLFRPCIYLPIHLISDSADTDLRYIFLHELQHYKHRDALANYLINLALAFYWFNPLIWYARKEMYSDREIACDASVLDVLEEGDYSDYGMTLLHYAERISHASFSFSAGISGSMRQMKQRILNIASYEKPSPRKKLRGAVSFLITALLVLTFAPALSAYAADSDRYHFDTSSGNISYADFSSYFDGYEGCFVLYDSENNSFQIYNFEQATRRTAPNSTYKIYDALFGLESGVITTQHSQIPWDGTEYPIEAWNSDHDLPSAMHDSVNWYFQKIDAGLGKRTVEDYIRKIGYGNQTVGPDLSSYWLESTLKISPLEQVELLGSLYTNDFDFDPENIAAVENSICISASENGSLYGKTGTGRVDGMDINGWFVGYVENAGHTYFFTVRITARDRASGSRACDIALAILSDLGIFSF